MSEISYEAIIGLEVHAELKTASKIFCACPTTFGAPPNTQCCPVCMGHPGTLPILNRHAVELAIRAGLALNCEIARQSRTDRKHYFYPDLPKAYQISQNEIPLCKNGRLTVSMDGFSREIGIARIHIEEDAGKLIHAGNETRIDFNRCGVPLIEIVSKPDLRSGAEAAAYLKALRAILSRCGVSDCKMQEGSLRCDVNISLREMGSEAFGTRVEIKNINSFAFVEKAIHYEITRQTELLRRGEEICMETRRFDSVKGVTELMRTKESAEDYRYLPEPDLLAIRLSEEEIERIADTLPELPAAQITRLTETYGIRQKDAEILSAELLLSDFFEAAAAKTRFPQIALNLLLTELLPHCASEPFSSPVSWTRLAELAELLGEGEINSATAKKLLSRLIKDDFSPADTVAKEGLAQIRDTDQLQLLVENAMQKMPQAVKDWLHGRYAAMRSLQGKIMAESGGRADPVLAEELLTASLEALKNGKENLES